MEKVLKTTAIVTALVLAGSSLQAADWEGPYIAGYAGKVVNGGEPVSLMGLQGGYNFNIANNFIAGVELDLSTTTDGSAITFYTANARLAYPVTPDILVYGLAGLGGNSVGTDIWAVGLGAQFALGDAMSLRAEYSTLGVLGSSGNNPGIIKIGASYGF